MLKDVPSFLPSGTGKLGPPDWKTASRPAKTVISAQETILPHSLWTRALISSIVFKASVLMPPFCG
ncbi:hypothetical protein MtrunA17_Chr6g0467131 [Medicago truncatula]|uniref:Uncharacterized protein n=1 Tax=Medicago truncatula TaxID=3880 RepID=A0A396HK83_MEDTR|nr:hypothetical protein MtrunA17_Chr6g0467131 [Medicago truncatula]